MPLSPEDYQTATAVLSVLRQEKFKDRMYLFLQPFNPDEVPGYFDIVPHKRILDLQTVTANLDKYNSLSEFWKDCQGIFENAIAYHADKPSKWISKMARDMLKVFKREKQKRQGGPSMEDTLSSEPLEKKKKVSLKLKLPSSQGFSPPQYEAPAEPIVALSSSSVSEPPTHTTDASLSFKPKDKKVIKAKPTQPKLKLKLSLGNKLKKEVKQEGSANIATTSKPVSAQAPPLPVAKPKISLKLGGGGGNSRGKELPKGVSNTASAPAAATSPTNPLAQPVKKPKKKKAAATNSSTTTGPSTLKLTTKHKGPFPTAQALKVLAGLRRRQNKSVAWFLQPVSDKAILADYKAKVKHPADISTMTAKIEKGAYSSIASFALDLRRIFGNCLVFNTSIKDSLRPVAVEVMETAEDLLKVFFKEYPGSYPPLLYCWKLCVGVLDTLFNLVNPADGQPTALYFLHPVSYYCGGQFPPDYHERIPKPMDFGTVTLKLLEGKYSAVDEFANDCRLVLSNCKNYYQGRADGVMYIEQANRLNDVLSQQVEQLGRYVKSSRGAADQAKASALVVLPQPPVSLLLNILQELRGMTYTDKATKISEPVMGPFEKPVSLSVFPDYLEHVTEPMDLSVVERKVKAGAYLTPEDFEFDVNLIFKNCENYNSKRGGDHLVNLAKFGARQFRRLFYNKMRAFEDPASVPQVKEERQEVQPDNTQSSPSKIIKIDASGISRGKTGPRISITAAQLSVAAARAKSPSQGLKKNTSSEPAVKPNQPVPLHIAIARVKEAFPLRRQIKSLQTWEANCAKYFKELMRHPWISAARPKFIFHVPVPTLFPELREAYAAKVRKPMDLTTVECALLAGNRYATPEDFISDVSLVFANAIRFNKDGRDVGDPLSCAYYEASIHLLRYSRWLSMELLAEYIDSSEHVDDDSPDGLPPFAWKLTEGNRRRAREEMEKLVLNEPIEKSLEGDRYTWPEAECEKLLKSLRHQSDLRYMTFFIQPNYPPDYTAYISSPMDWERVNRTLKKRHYDRFGDVIADLRLIFANALKYNGRLKGTDTVSGRAYEAATYMAAKLEAAINKLLLSVADRLERERIDHSNAEREIEAEDRAEEARIRAAWKKDPDAATAEGEAPPPAGATMPSQHPDAVTQKIRLVRRAAQRREATDFEIPFFDEEDDGQHERSHFEVVKFQKGMFEKQRIEQSKMRQCAGAIGSLVFARILQRNLALEWEEKELAKIAAANAAKEDMAEAKGDNAKEESKDSASQVLKELEREGRSPLQIKLSGSIKKSKGKKRKRDVLSLE